MKIVYIYPVFTQLAGTERVFTDKMNYLAEYANYDITLLTYEQGPHSFPFPLSSKVNHIDLNVRFFHLYRYWRLVRWYKEWKLNRTLRHKFNIQMKEINPDIVIAPTYFVNVLKMIAKCPCKFIKILESHIDKRYVYANDGEIWKGGLSYVRSKYDAIAVGKLASKFDLLVALSPEDAKDWSRYLKTIVIPNVVNIQRERISDLNNKRVVFAGRLVEQKGISFLLKIWERVHSLYPDWSLDIYGEGKLRDKITGEQFSKLNIHVYGPTSCIIDKFCESSLFVLTSVYEPFGLVLPEAMSCGLPVVSFDCDYGPRKIITNGVDGFLVPVGDTDKFAERVCQLIEDPQLRQKMGSAGIRSSQRYSPDNIMPQWISLFEEVLSSR